MSPLRVITAAFAKLNIPYAIGGSVASSVRGIGRATLDVDILARILPVQAGLLAAALGPEWYLDSESASRCIVEGRAFNVIHMISGAKFDLFPATGDFHDSELMRAAGIRIDDGGESVECPVASAEDILLAKLEWFRQGGESSGRQWEDILGIIGSNPAMEIEYVRRWAAKLGVSDLLDRALTDARR